MVNRTFSLFNCFSIIRSRLVLLISVCLMPAGLLAQDKSVEMADGMRSNGKIYIVVAVCLTILIGLFLYLMRIDRKINKIEKNKHIE